MVTPIRGANRTATIHESRRASATTAKSENVYSPAALLAKPIGTKPVASYLENITERAVENANAFYRLEGYHRGLPSR
jgi:hypothetical protein